MLGIALGAFVAYRLYATYRARDPLVALGAGYRVLEWGFAVDEIYRRFLVRPIQYRLSAAVNGFNRWVLDGAVHATAYAARGLGWAVDAFDRRAIDGAVNGVAEITDDSGGLLRYLQSGNIQRYAALLFAGVVVLIVMMIWI
jgi:NADH:ubiquinone oxidoreductase subunit 5 (subunit L)/multisubunit Na+/H+ antiporter MnhA subunit